MATHWSDAIEAEDLCRAMRSVAGRMFVDSETGEVMVWLLCSVCEKVYDEVLGTAMLAVSEKEGCQCVSCDEKAEESSGVVTVNVTVRA